MLNYSLQLQEAGIAKHARNRTEDSSLALEIPVNGCRAVECSAQE